MATLPKNAPRNRIWQCGDPEPADHPDVVSMSMVRFHWEPMGWFRCDDERTVFPWIYLIESFQLVSEDTSHVCAHRKKKGRAAS
jgi:hypothetical protein